MHIPPRWIHARPVLRNSLGIGLALLLSAPAHAGSQCHLFAAVVEMLNKAETPEQRQAMVDRFMVGALGNRPALAAVVRAINFTKRGGSTDAAWMQCGGT